MHNPSYDDILTQLVEQESEVSELRRDNLALVDQVNKLHEVLERVMVLVQTHNYSGAEAVLATSGPFLTRS
jgi:hypothetical protein